MSLIQPRRARHQGWSTETHLVALVAALIVPVLAFTAVLLTQFAESERTRYETNALETARRIALAVDRELSGLQTALHVLSTSRVLEAGDYERFYQQAVLTKNVLGSDIILKNTSGQQIVNTRFPWGAALPSSLPEGDRISIETKQPYISNVFVGATAGRPIISINVPVVKNGATEHLLIMGMFPERLAQLLETQALPPEWTGAIVDRNGAIVARSRQHEQFVGKMATDDLREQAVAEEGTWPGVNAEGSAVLSAYASSKLTGWRIAVDVPAAAVERPLRRSLGWLGGAGAVVLAASCLLASWLSQRMSHAMGGLAQAADGLAKGRIATAERFSVREVNEAAEALVRAAADLRLREAERDRAEAALKANSERLERVLNTSPIAIAELNDRGEITYANAAAEQILGLSAAALAGHRYDAPTWDIRSLAGEPIEAADLPAARALRGETVAGYEHAIVSPGTGERRILAVNAAPVVQSGRVVGALAAFTDITARHEADQAVRRSEERFRAAVSAMSGVLWTNNAAGEMQGEQPGWAALTGQSLQEYQGYGWAEAVHPDDAQPTIRAWREAVSARKTFVFEHRVKCSDSAWRIFSIRAVPVLERDGTVREWVGVHTDITEQRAAEERQAFLLALGDRLRDIEDPMEVMAVASEALARHLRVARAGYGEGDPSQQYFIVERDWTDGTVPSVAGRHRMNDFGPEVIEELKSGRTITIEDAHNDARTSFPEAVAAYAGIQARALVVVPLIKDGRFTAMLYIHHPAPRSWTEQEVSLVQETAERTWSAVQRARAEAELRSLTETLEQQVQERTQELVDTNRKLLHEVTHRESVEEQLRQAQKMEAVGQLTGGIAHDFNNLLAIIIGSLQAIQRRLDTGQVGALLRYVDSASEAASRAATLTHRLLAFARQQPLSPEPINANALVAGMSDLLRRSIGEAVRIETILAGGLWYTHADPHQLENAILNLAVNGRDAMAEGGRLTIETANVDLDEHYAAENPEVTPGEYVMVAVTDTGSGMPPDVIAKAFDPFFTTKPVGQGTGLGLSQVYGFVRQTGGHIKVYSEVGQGTTVKLYLPRFAGEISETREQEEPKPLPRARRRETILVVEDEPAVRRLSVEALEELGYRVLQADSAAAGLLLLDAHPETKLLFTDVVMPDVNGRKLADEALQRRPDLKVLFTTGYTRNAVIHNGVLDSGVQLLVKPFTLVQLASKVRDILDREQEDVTA